MRIAILGGALFTLAVGCGGSKETTPSLYSTWYEAQSTYGIGLTLTGSGTYVLQTILPTGGTTFEDQVEKGSFVKDGATLTFTPLEWTCTATGPGQPWTATYSQYGNNLELATTSVVYGFTLDTATLSQGQITLGCFTSTGFVAQPLAPLP